MKHLFNILSIVLDGIICRSLWLLKRGKSKTYEYAPKAKKNGCLNYICPLIRRFNKQKHIAGVETFLDRLQAK